MSHPPTILSACAHLHIHSLMHSLTRPPAHLTYPSTFPCTHPRTHQPTHPPTDPPTYSPTHPPTHPLSRHTATHPLHTHPPTYPTPVTHVSEMKVAGVSFQPCTEKGCSVLSLSLSHSLSLSLSVVIGRILSANMRSFSNKEFMCSCYFCGLLANRELPAVRYHGWTSSSYVSSSSFVAQNRNHTFLFAVESFQPCADIMNGPVSLRRLVLESIFFIHRLLSTL